MSMPELRRRAVEAGFDHSAELTIERQTPRVNPTVFLRQYLEGKQQPPTDIDKYLAHDRVKELAAAKATTTYEDGTMEFMITMNVVIVSSSPAKN